MSPKSFLLTPEIAAYLGEHNPPVDAVLADLIERTWQLGPIANMQISPEQGAFLSQVVRLVGARNAIELGTFTGYSSICIARGMGRGTRLLCCDVSEEWTNVAREHWLRAGVADQIELRLAPALETLHGLGDATFDFVFIDAVKTEYIAYYEELVPRLTDRGLMVIDNVLWSGKVADPDVTDDDTVAIRAFNRHVADDPRTEAVMLPIADGTTVVTRAA